MRRRKIVQLDTKTGEVMDGLVVYVVRKRRNGFGERWMAMAQEAAMLFAERRKELGEEGFAVLMVLIAKLDFENHLVLNQAEIGRWLGMHRQSVQQAIKRLMGMGAVLEGPKIGQNRSYRFNPEFGWKGSALNHIRALDDYRKQKRSRGEPAPETE